MTEKKIMKFYLDEQKQNKTMKNHKWTPNRTQESTPTTRTSQDPQISMYKQNKRKHNARQTRRAARGMSSQLKRQTFKKQHNSKRSQNKLCWHNLN